VVVLHKDKLPSKVIERSPEVVDAIADKQGISAGIAATPEM